MATRPGAIAERPAVAVRTDRTEEPSSGRNPAVSKPGVGEGRSTVQHAHLHHAHDPKRTESAESEEQEPQDRFCGLLTSFDSCLPTCIVDYIDQFCLTIYNCIAPIFGWEPATPAGSEPGWQRIDSIVLGVYSSEESTMIRLVNGGNFQVIGKLNSPLDWMATRVRIADDGQTKKEVLEAAQKHQFMFKPSMSCINSKTGECVRVIPTGGFGVNKEEIQRKGPAHLETAVYEIKPVSGLDSLPLLGVQGGASYYRVQGNIDPSHWPLGEQIIIQDDAQTAEDGTQVCENARTKNQVRVRHFLNI